MLGRHRPAEPDASASYAVVWANLRKRYPGLRTILITSASRKDDPSQAALGLAEAAVRLEGVGSVLVMVLDSARQDRRGLGSPAASIRIISALSLAQVRIALSAASEEFAHVIVVVPPPQQGPDCIAMAGVADAAILAVRSGRTRFGEAQLAAELLRQAGVPPAAALLLPRRAVRSSAAEAAARTVGQDSQIAELPMGLFDRPKERREASAGIDVPT